MVSPKLKYPEVAGMLIGGICEVTMKTRAAKTAAKAILVVVDGRWRSSSIIITVLSALLLCWTTL